MTALLLSPKNAKEIDSILDSGVHALLISGEPGAGKRTIAEYIVQQMLDVKLVSGSAYVLHIGQEEKSIGIEQIRDLQRFLQLKTTGSSRLRRAIIVENSDAMTIEAQNAFLKILEEPPADTIIVLTSSQPAKLRSTIHSRVQILHIQSPSIDDLNSHFESQGFSKSEISRAHAVSSGQVGLMTALLTDKDNPLAVQIEQAKKLYTIPVFERLALIDELSKNKETLPGLLYACKRVCSGALIQAAGKNQQATISWHKRLSRVVAAEENLAKNANSKLLLTDLLLNI